MARAWQFEKPRHLDDCVLLMPMFEFCGMLAFVAQNPRGAMSFSTRQCPPFVHASGFDAIHVTRVSAIIDLNSLCFWTPEHQRVW